MKTHGSSRRFVARACIGGAVIAVVACSSSETPVVSEGDAGAEGSAPPPADDGSFADVAFNEPDTGHATGGPNDGSLSSDATPDVDAGEGGCFSGDAGSPPLAQRCAPSTTNECDGATDTSLAAFGVSVALRNGAGGNGFDDDCDGLVDEGCTCGGNGQTKDCYLVPASQIDVATKKPVGWCTDNSKGSLDCTGNEFPKWSGSCRGAQPPFRHDVCAAGDYNCDGLARNSDVNA